MSMSRATPVWTERLRRILVLVALLCAGSLAGVPEGEPVAVWVAAGLFLGVAVGLTLDVWGGLVAGLGAAALVVGLRQATGHWSSEVFLPALVETATIVLAASWAGALGRFLRTADGPRPTDSGDLAPYGDLGLLGPDAARARLEEEVAASARDGAGLGLLLVDVRLAGEGTPPGLADAARRCVARLVETRTTDLDVPFALSDDRLGVLFPHASREVVWDCAGRLVDGIEAATVTAEPDRRQVALSDLLTVRLAVSEQPAGEVDAENLMRDTSAALDAAPEGEPA